MTIKTPIQFRAIHTITRWRKAQHASRESALGNKRGARALFSHRNKAIDFEKHGEPRYVIVWDERLPCSGEIVRPGSDGDTLDQAKISDKDIERYERGVPPTDAELERLFHTNVRADGAEPGEQLERQLQLRILVSRDLSAHARRVRLAAADPKPARVTVVTTAFVRNADVIVEVLERAAGHCEHCGRAAPFTRSSDGEPYLEVHHRIRLADGGDDSVGNAEALCPNCHKQKHHG